MPNYSSDYEDIDGIQSLASETIYQNPVFDDEEEVGSNLPLINRSNNSNQSPYEEVAVNVSNKDDQEMSCLTVRSVVVGLILTCIVAFTTQFFALRTSPIEFHVGIVILLSFMISGIYSNILPEKIFKLTINPGPFTIKEQSLITIMAISGASTYYAVESIVIQRFYYKFELSNISGIFYLILMHLLAFSMAGIFQRYLVWPAEMIWPKTLMSCGLIRALNVGDEPEKIESQWTLKRSTFFWIFVLIQAVWYFFPGYIFPLLSSFSFICMIAPKNIVLSQITGSNGLGLGALQFDWNGWVAYLESPILVPFWANVNTFIGFIFFVWILTPIFYYTNVWHAKTYPIVSNRVFDNTGHVYNVTKVLDKTLHFNETAYELYGEINLSVGYMVLYIATFATVSALIIHAILYHGKSMVEQFRAGLADNKNDIHAKMMSRYPQVSEWWYYVMLFLSFIMALLYCHLNGLLPGHILLVAIILNMIIILPSGIITAMTSISTTSTAISDLISGLLLPGNPIAYLTFRTYTFACQTQAMIVLTNFKIAHYMKIPPRITFVVLIVCPMLTSVINYITAAYLLGNVPNICTSKNLVWQCSNLQSSYTLSVMWGVVGAKRLFGVNSKYWPLLFGFLLGAISPVISWTLSRRFTSIKWLALINFPIIYMATINMPPAPAVEFPSWFLVGFIFNYILYRHAHHWWTKYAFIFTAAMSCGVVISGLIIFFVFQNNDIHFPKWWGTGGPTGDGCPLAVANYSGFVPTNDDL